jgi:hypothetical protein
MIIWLTSYPKSGNTWVRFFILSLLLGNKREINLDHLKNIEQFPSKSQFVGLELDLKNLREVAKNWITVQKKINSNKKVRFYKTHNTLCQIDKNSFTDHKNTLGAIYIVRDPRNVITSVKNHFNHNSYEEAKNFIFDEKRVVLLSRPTNKKDYSLPQIIGSWQTHYKTWKIMNKNFLLIKYENLINTPNSEFKKIANYLERLFKTKFTNEQIRRAINLSSFDRLQKMEEKNGFIESVENKQTGEKNKFFFLGPKNDWKKILDKEIADEISSRFEPEMKELRYL